MCMDLWFSTWYLSFNVKEFTLQDASLLLSHLDLEDSRLIHRSICGSVSERVRFPKRPQKVKRDESILQQWV